MKKTPFVTKQQVEEIVENFNGVDVLWILSRTI